jgi:hypothetical protein
MTKKDVHRKGALYQLLYFYIFITFIMSSNIGGQENLKINNGGRKTIGEIL